LLERTNFTHWGGTSSLQEINFLKSYSEPMDLEEVEIAPISVEELRADKPGVLVEQMAALAYHAFREAPWSDDHEKPRLHLGLGVDLMRRSALAFIAKTKPFGKIVGYILGYEVFRESDDPRDLALCEISGTKALDYLFEGGEGCFMGILSVLTWDFDGDTSPTGLP
jgi:hypothetical protein